MSRESPSRLWQGLLAGDLVSQKGILCEEMWYRPPGLGQDWPRFCISYIQTRGMERTKREKGLLWLGDGESGHLQSPHGVGNPTLSLRR